MRRRRNRGARLTLIDGRRGSGGRGPGPLMRRKTAPWCIVEAAGGYDRGATTGKFRVVRLRPPQIRRYPSRQLSRNPCRLGWRKISPGAGKRSVSTLARLSGLIAAEAIPHRCPGTRATDPCRHGLEGNRIGAVVGCIAASPVFPRQAGLSRLGGKSVGYARDGRRSRRPNRLAAVSTPRWDDDGKGAEQQAPFSVSCLTDGLPT